MTRLQVCIARHPLKLGIGWDQVEGGLDSVGHLLWHDARADGWAVRGASTMVARTALISQAEGSDAEYLLIEADIGRPLQRRVARRVGVKGIGADEMRRGRHGGDVGVLRGRSSVALELRLRPVANLVGEEGGLGP